MNIHEYQAKALFSQYGIPIPKGRVVFSIDKVQQAANELIEETQKQTLVVKAQIHAGGRGKAGGVKVVTGREEAASQAKALFDKVLVTKQTGLEGKTVKKLYIEEGLDIEHEFYLALMVDRERARIVVIVSSEGGTEIEDSKGSIYRMWIHPSVGFMPYQGRFLALRLGLGAYEQKQLITLLHSLVRLFLQEDCSLVEINPLILTKDKNMVALDAKISFDENASYRHKEWKSLEDENEIDPREMEAKSVGLSYIQLDGNIGCLVNGAGLAMATMDTIKYFGGSPANFLDVGGGASQQAVTQAFKIILKSSYVQGIFVNIFGGIMKCDVIARAVVLATKELGLSVPLVVRLAGTNVDKGKEILVHSGLNIIPASTMAEGAKKITELVT